LDGSIRTAMRRATAGGEPSARVRFERCRRPDDHDRYRKALGARAFRTVPSARRPRPIPESPRRARVSNGSVGPTTTTDTGKPSARSRSLSDISLARSLGSLARDRGRSATPLRRERASPFQSARTAGLRPTCAWGHAPERGRASRLESGGSVDRGARVPVDVWWERGDGGWEGEVDRLFDGFSPYFRISNRITLIFEPLSFDRSNHCARHWRTSGNA
jgi:hypothetical protein